MFECNGDDEEPVFTDSEDEDLDVEFHDLELFFHAIEAPDYVEMFTKQKVTLAQLLEMDEQDLISCGVELVGDRKKILASTGQMHCEKWVPTSLNDLTERALLSCPGIYVSINDINKHLEYIGATLKYIRKRVLTRPEILELGNDFVRVTKIESELADMLITSTNTHSDIEALHSLMKMKISNPHLQPANHIDQHYSRSFKLTRKLIPPILLTATLASVCLSFKLWNR